MLTVGWDPWDPWDYGCEGEGEGLIIVGWGGICGCWRLRKRKRGREGKNGGEDGGEMIRLQAGGREGKIGVFEGRQADIVGPRLSSPPNDM